MAKIIFYEKQSNGKWLIRKPMFSKNYFVDIMLDSCKELLGASIDDNATLHVALGINTNRKIKQAKNCIFVY